MLEKIDDHERQENAQDISKSERIQKFLSWVQDAYNEEVRNVCETKLSTLANAAELDSDELYRLAYEAHASLNSEDGSFEPIGDERTTSKLLLD